MPNPFWNHTERRLRAGWRMLLQIVLFAIATQLTGLIVLLAAWAVGSAAGQIPGGLAPQALYNAIVNYIFSSPGLRTAAILSEIAGVLLALWLAGRLLDRRRFADFGFHFNRRWWIDLAFGAFLGAILMVFIFVVELAAGWITVVDTFYVLPQIGFSFWIVALVGFINFISVSIREEVLSRGYHLRNIAEGLNLPRLSPRTALIIGYVISSTIFGLLHMFNPNATLTSTLNIIIAGFMLGMGYVLTGELSIPIGLHLTWNFFQGYVFGFPVSGGTSRAAVFAIEQGGPEIWTGGAFGPEAGIIGLIAMILGCWLTVLWVRRTWGKAELQDRLAIYSGQDAPAISEPLHPGAVIENT